MSAKKLLADLDKAIWYTALSKGGPVYLYTYESSKLLDNTKDNKTPFSEIIGLPLESFSDADSDSYWSYYGGRPLFSRELTEKFLKDYSSGIDWKKTIAVVEDTKTSFEGTEAESGEKRILTGVLYLNSGNYYPWICSVDFSNEIREILGLIAEFEDWTEQAVLEKVAKNCRNLLKNPYINIG